MEDNNAAAADWTQRRRSKGSTMADVALKQEQQRLWGKIQEKEREIREEVRECRKQSRKTQRYLNLVKDMNKLKAEYEKAMKKKPYNPLSLEDGEKASVNSVIGPIAGTHGPDSDVT